MKNTNDESTTDTEKIVPQNIIEGLNEFAYGGFILFAFSSEGNPLSFFNYETQKDRLALLQTAKMFVDNEIAKNMFKEAGLEEQED